MRIQADPYEISGFIESIGAFARCRKDKDISSRHSVRSGAAAAEDDAGDGHGFD